MKINWSYLPKQFSDDVTTAILEELKEFLPTGDLTLGKPVAEFERRFAKMIGTKHAIGVNSGTDAIKLSLKALGVGPGDEVITTANTFIATVGAIGELFATPVFVDCTDNFCMDVDQVENAITPKTKAIVPVHYAGQMTDINALKSIADKYGLPIVEDSCQCILGDIKGVRSGTTGVTGAFSLHPLKNLNVWGDGGVIVTNDDRIYDTLNLLRNHGLRSRDEVEILGCNSRLDSVQAVVGNWLIDQVESITDQRIKNAARLDAGLSEIKDITIPMRYTDRKLVYHLYIVFAERRDELYDYCKANGIPAKIHYPVPVYLQPAVKHLHHQQGDFPVTDRHSATMISFPAHDHMTDEELDYIIQKVNDFYNG